MHVQLPAAAFVFMTDQAGGAVHICACAVGDGVEEVHADFSVTCVAGPKRDLKRVGFVAGRWLAMRKRLRIDAFAAQDDFARSAMAQHMQPGQLGVVDELFYCFHGLISRSDRYGIYTGVQALQQDIDLFDRRVVDQHLFEGWIGGALGRRGACHRSLPM